MNETPKQQWHRGCPACLEKGQPEWPETAAPFKLSDELRRYVQVRHPDVSNQYALLRA